MNRPTLRRTLPMLALLLTTYCGGSSSEQFDAKAPDVQFIDQYNPAGKDAHYNGTEYCGPAVLAGMAKARGLSGGLSDADLVNRLAQLAGTDPRSGTTGNGMIAALHSLGLRTDANQGADAGWIDNQLTSGHDIIAQGDFYSVPGRENPALRAGLNAVFVPHGNTWILEHDEVIQPDPPSRLLVVENFAALRDHF